MLPCDSRYLRYLFPAVLPLVLLSYRRLLVLLFTMALALLGREPARAQQLQGGLRAGGHVGRGFGADANGGGFRLGYHAGLSGRAAFSSRWSLHPEALYTVKGDASPAYGPSIQARLSYLEVPVLARFTLDDAFVEAGPYAALLLRHRLNDQRLQVAGVNPYRGLDYGLLLGFGYQDPDGLSLSWRYAAGLANVYRPVDFSGAVEQVGLRHGVLQFTFGYLLPWTWGRVREARP